jgi:hypothetical protein
MHADRFEHRLAVVRHRFATALESKIQDAVVSANRMCSSSEDGIKHVSDSYRRLNSICGVGPAAGFAATSEAAHFAEVTLLPAHREGREPTEREVLSLKKALEHLRVVAASELRSMYQRGG